MFNISTSQNNDHVGAGISAGISKSARLVARNAVMCCIYLPAEHSRRNGVLPRYKVRYTMKHVLSDPNKCLSVLAQVLIQPSHTTSNIRPTKSPYMLIPLTLTHLRANLLNGVEDGISIGHACLLSPVIEAEGDDLPCSVETKSIPGSGVHSPPQ